MCLLEASAGLRWPVGRVLYVRYRILPFDDSLFTVWGTECLGSIFDLDLPIDIHCKPYNPFVP